MINKKSFSEENLVLLFHLISRRFPKPEELFVTVFTDLEDVETPEEMDLGRFSEIGGSPNAPNQQDTAIFTRGGEIKNILIHYADGESDEIEVK